MSPSSTDRLPSSPSPHPPFSSFSSPNPALCPYSCIDEFTIGSFKGAFAGALWGGYSLYKNLRLLSSSSPLASLAAAHPLPSRLRALSPMLVYPLKFAVLMGCYRLLTCGGCHLSAPAPSAPLLTEAASASLAGFIVSLPHLDPRHSLRMAAGCGALGGLLGLGALCVDGWRSTGAHRHWGREAELRARSISGKAH